MSRPCPDHVPNILVLGHGSKMRVRFGTWLGNGLLRIQFRRIFAELAGSGPADRTRARTRPGPGPPLARAGGRQSGSIYHYLPKGPYLNKIMVKSVI